MPLPLPETCHEHPMQQIRFFCRAQTCMMGLCAECILAHARHDFTAANESAASEVKSIVRQAQRVCKKQAKHLKTVKQVTDTKITALTQRREEEFGRLNTVFSELKAMLDERHKYLKELFENEIRDVEVRLQSDIKLINE